MLLNSPQNYYKSFKYTNIMQISLKNGNTLEVEQIKFCSLSSGVKIGLFRNLDKRSKFSGNFVLVVKLGREFLHQLNFLTLVTSIQTYLDYICRYA